MRNGGGKEKGSNYERAVGKLLSNWLTNGERGDLFARNVLSGGQFTLSHQKGKKEGIPGDLIAMHPLAFEFLSHYFIECKHYANLDWQAFIYDTKGTAFLSKVIAKCREEAKRSGLEFFLIVKQDRKPSMVLCEAHVLNRSCFKHPAIVREISVIKGIGLIPLNSLMLVAPRLVMPVKGRVQLIKR